MKSLKPIIPYYGGKRKIAPLIATIIRSQLKEDSTYYEPFIGGGAVYLELNHPKSVIGDVVPDLINMYECIKNDWQKVKFHYDLLPNNKKRYYQIRNFDRNPYFESRDRYFKAGRFIYLCRTAFGSCRWNQYGQMNQSYSQHSDRPYYLDDIDLIRMQKLLKTTEIHHASFEETIKEAKKGDVIYLDPPYVDTKYDQYWITKFKHSDLETLKTHCDELDKKGVKFILSHSSSEYVKDLYQDYNIISLEMFRDIQYKDATPKRTSKEVLITNIDNVLELYKDELVIQTKIVG